MENPDTSTKLKVEETKNPMRVSFQDEAGQSIIAPVSGQDSPTFAGRKSSREEILEAVGNHIVEGFEEKKEVKDAEGGTEQNGADLKPAIKITHMSNS